MNTQHTPGPWHNNGLDVYANYTDEHGNRHHCHVATVTNRNELNRGPSMEEYESARLIAAARDLLAALDELAALFERAGKLHPSRDLREVIADPAHLAIRARAVIARAKGE